MFKNSREIIKYILFYIVLPSACMLGIQGNKIAQIIAFIIFPMVVLEVMALFYYVLHMKKNRNS